MTEVLLIVLLIAVIAAIGWFVVRNRHDSTQAMPAEDRPGAVESGTSGLAAVSPTPADVTTPTAVSSPLPPEPEPEEEPGAVAEPELEPEPADESVAVDEPEPEVVEPEPEVVEPEPEVVEPEPEVIEPEVVDTVPEQEPEPVVEPLPEPDPVIEPAPPDEPEPIMEPEPPIEPEPIIEPDTARVGSPPGDHPAADPDEPTDPPQAVIDAGEMPAQELDPHAGWEADGDRTIRADPESGLYHTPDSPGYIVGEDVVEFESEEAAREAGFTRWDQQD